MSRMYAGEDEGSRTSLTPPKPFFHSQHERNSWTSQDSSTSSADVPGSPSTSFTDSDRDQQPSSPLSSAARSYRQSSRAAPGSPYRKKATFMIHQGEPDSQPPSENGHGSYQPPPSSFAFPFQSYPGNPDPGTHIPSTGTSYSRRSSWDSIQRAAQHQTPSLTHTGSLTDLHRPNAPFMATSNSSSANQSSNSVYRNSAASAAAMNGHSLPHSPSTHSFRAPFLSPASRPSSSLWSPPPLPPPPLPYNAAFLGSSSSSAPASPAASSALLALPKNPKPPFPSTRLSEKLTVQDKPWLATKDSRTRTAWWLTLSCFLLGVIASGIVCWQGIASVVKLDDSQLCLVMDEQFSSGDIDQDSWSRDVELSGFDNGEFSMTTSSSDNAYIQNGQLYIFPTLTSDTVSNVLDGGSYTLQDCTASAPPSPPVNQTNTDDGGGNGNGNTNSTGNANTGNGGNGAGNGGNGGGQAQGNGNNNGNGTNAGTGGGGQQAGGNAGGNGGGAAGGGAGNQKRQNNGGSSGNGVCSVTSSAGTGTVINPVMSARLSTKGKKSIRFGKVEFRAKMPRGDWLWPKVFMLPENNTYGPGLMSGEIDLLLSRGNLPPYPATIGSVHSMTSRFLYSPVPPSMFSPIFPISSPTPVTAAYTLLGQVYGYFTEKQKSFNDEWHIFGMEWTQDWARMYVDNRLGAVLDLRFQKGGQDGYFWKKAKFPETAENQTMKFAVQNPWEGQTVAAPFDQDFHLVIALAAGGTSGWFPDGQGGKPWFDASGIAMQEFAKAQDTWSKTWPENPDDRALRLDYVKMWQLCK